MIIVLVIFQCYERDSIFQKIYWPPTTNIVSIVINHTLRNEKNMQLTIHNYSSAGILIAVLFFSLIILNVQPLQQTFFQKC